MKPPVGRSTRPARISGLVVGAAAFLSASFQMAEAGDEEAGRSLAEARCSRCHATGPAGNSPLPAAPAFRTIHKRYPIENIEEALGEGIFVGHSPMPDFTFSSLEVGDLIAYLKTLETPEK